MMKSEEPVRQPEVEKGATWLGSAWESRRKKERELGHRGGGGGEKREGGGEGRGGGGREEGEHLCWALIGFPDW